jgi:hypothetical protein
MITIYFSLPLCPSLSEKTIESRQCGNVVIQPRHVVIQPRLKTRNRHLAPLRA